MSADDVAELTPLQRAYLAGRGVGVPLGGRAMREYREYTGLRNAQRIREIVAVLAERHEALRLTIDPDRAVQWVADRSTVTVETLDRSAVSERALRCELDEIRDRLTGAESERRAPVEIVMVEHASGVTLLLSVDSVIVDGAGLNRLVADAATLYAGEELPDAPGGLIGALRTRPAESDADREYWDAQAAAVGPVPSLPWRAPLGAVEYSDYRRVGVTVEAAARAAAKKAGAKRKLFENTAVLAALTESIRRWSGSPGFRLCVPVGSNGAADQPVGPFSDFVVVDVPDGPTLVDRATALQRSMLSALSHRTVSGTSVARRLMTVDPGAQPACPVTFTNGLAWPACPEVSGVREVARSTATPQVALDLRVTANRSGGLFLHADYAVAAIDESVVVGILTCAAELLETMTDDDCWLRQTPVGDLVVSARQGDADPDPWVWLVETAVARVRGEVVERGADTVVPLHWFSGGGLAAVARAVSDVAAGLPVDPVWIAGARTIGDAAASLRARSGPELTAAVEVAHEIAGLTGDEVDSLLD